MPRAQSQKPAGDPSQEPAAEQPQKPAAESAVYKVLGNLKHNGKNYRKGHTVKLTSQQAEHLKRHKIIEVKK